VRVGGHWRYVYRAIDQFGQVIDVFVSPRQDAKAAHRFFERAIGATKVTPVEVTTDPGDGVPGGAVGAAASGVAPYRPVRQQPGRVRPHPADPEWTRLLAPHACHSSGVRSTWPARRTRQSSAGSPAPRPPVRNARGEGFCTNACPAMITSALRSCLSPRIGRSRAFSRPWSHSIRLLAYWSVRCHAAGSSASSTAGYTGARSVVTSTGRTLVEPMACWKNRSAASASRRAQTNTSITWPN
jgi:DDE domain